MAARGLPCRSSIGLCWGRRGEWEEWEEWVRAGGERRASEAAPALKRRSSFGPVCYSPSCRTRSLPPPLHSLPLFMAQVATMGPPLSPRETRRSGRRSAPSGSTSTSKSPDSPNSESAPRLPVVNRSSSASSRKRTKQEDVDDPPDDSHKSGSNGTPNALPPLQNGNGRTKRKGKEKEKPVLNLAIDSILAEGGQPNVVLELNGDPDAEEEEQGVTRCVCGNAGMLLFRPRPLVVLYDWQSSLRVDFPSGTRFHEIVAHWVGVPRIR